MTAATRAFFEARFGRDFSGVRVHTGAAAERSARDVSAAAYTVGPHIVFGAGRLALETPSGRWLMAHELAHVVQQGVGEATMVRRFFIFGAGYPNPYPSEKEEAASVAANTWMPSTSDFIETVRGSGGGSGVTTVDEFYSTIQERLPHSITALGLIAHGAKGGIGFSGIVAYTPDAAVTITDDGLITSESLLANPDAYMNARDRFAENAVLTLYSCNSGSDQVFVDNLSQAFNVCVRGFSQGIDWCIGTNADGTIASRGRTRVGGVPPTPGSGCTEYETSIGSLTPDISSSSRCGGGGSK